ncbi:hypothetical protein P9112_008753 [Eukaryota sp. TZLM1-RC]
MASNPQLRVVELLASTIDTHTSYYNQNARDAELIKAQFIRLSQDNHNLKSSLNEALSTIDTLQQNSTQPTSPPQVSQHDQNELLDQISSLKEQLNETKSALAKTQAQLATAHKESKETDVPAELLALRSENSRLRSDIERLESDTLILLDKSESIEELSLKESQLLNDKIRQLSLQLESSQSTVSKLRDLSTVQAQTIESLEQKLRDDEELLIAADRNLKESMIKAEGEREELKGRGEEKVVKMGEVIGSLKRKVSDLEGEKGKLLENFSMQVKNMIGTVSQLLRDAQVSENSIALIQSKLNVYRRDQKQLIHVSNDVTEVQKDDIPEDQSNPPISVDNSELTSVYDRLQLLSITTTNVERRCTSLKSLLTDLFMDESEISSTSKTKALRLASGVADEVSGLKSFLIEVRESLVTILDYFERALDENDSLVNHTEELSTTLTKQEKEQSKLIDNLQSTVESQSQEINQLSSTVKNLQSESKTAQELNISRANSKILTELDQAKNNERFAKEVLAAVREEKEVAEEECRLLEGQVDRLKREVSDLRVRNDGLIDCDEEVFNLRGQVSSLTSEIEELQKDIAVLRQENRALSSQNEELASQNKDIQESSCSATNKLKSQVNQLSLRVKELEEQLEFSEKHSKDLEIQTKSLKMTNKSLENDLNASNLSKTELLKKTRKISPEIETKTQEVPNSFELLSRKASQETRKLTLSSATLPSPRSEHASPLSASTPLREPQSPNFSKTFTPRSSILKKHMRLQ